MNSMSRVIVADDDSLVRQLLKDLLTREGLEVELCPDGEEALRRAEADGEAALFILDLEMPKLSGLEVIRALRARRILTPVLLVSAAEDHPGIPAALALSGVQFLPKPFRVAEIRESVGRLLGRSRR